MCVILTTAILSHMRSNTEMIQTQKTVCKPETLNQL